MRKLILALLVAFWAGSAFAQTATPTLMPLAPGAGTTDFSAFRVNSCTFDPASLNLGQSEEKTCIVPGIQPGDLVVVYAPPSLEAALVHSGTRIAGNNQVVIRVSSLVNATNGSSRNWEIISFNRTQAQMTPGLGPTQTPTPTDTSTPVPPTATATAS